MLCGLEHRLGRVELRLRDPERAVPQVRDEVSRHVRSQRRLLAAAVRDERRRLLRHLQ